VRKAESEVKESETRRLPPRSAPSAPQTTVPANVPPGVPSSVPPSVQPPTVPSAVESDVTALQRQYQAELELQMKHQVLCWSTATLLRCFDHATNSTADFFDVVLYKSQ